jgi:hypothetical protein
MECNRKTIWNFEQNKPSLIVKDICNKYPEVSPDFVYEVLLKRGIFKWLAARRDIIKIKNTWREKVRELNRKKSQKEVGYLKALEHCRKDIRKICHSDRWRAPDFDKKANNFLLKMEEG